MTQSSNIHPSAIVASTASLGSGVEIGAFSVIGEHAVIGDNVKIHHHVVIDGNTKIGDGCEIFPFASLGLPPQHIHYKGEPSELIIGKNNLIREQVTMHRGTEIGNMRTVVGDNNFIFVGAHIAHDCIIGSHNILANYVGIGGHVEVGDYAYLGAYSAYHQFVRIGGYSIIGGQSTIVNDVIPFGNASGPRATLNGLNITGMKRRDFSSAQIKMLRKFFTLLFEADGVFSDRLAQAKAEFSDNEEAMSILQFIEDGDARALCHPQR